jgi:hypothetical protein
MARVALPERYVGSRRVQSMSMTTGGKSSRRFFAMRLAAKGLLALLFFASCATALRAQTIQIMLVNGKTGRPITDRSLLKVWVGHIREFSFMVPADKHGVALLRLTDKDSEINVPECKGMQADAEKLLINPNKKDTKEFNEKYKYCTSFEVDNPIVRYADSISVQTLPGDISWKAGGGDRSMGYVPCWVDSNQNKYSWTTITDFSTKDVLQQGVVTANTCSSATVSANPGQIILFVRLPSNVEYLRQYVHGETRDHLRSW